MSSNRKVWVIIGTAAVVVTAAGVYFYTRSRDKAPKSMRVRRIEAVIREAEELMRRQRALSKKS